MFTLTGDTLSKICPHLGNKADSIANSITTICPLYGINSLDILEEFLANVIEECGEFTKFEENLNYSVDRLMVVWPSRFPSLKDAQPYAKNPEALANKVYGGRADLGNTIVGDGWLFRGSGPIQITGRYMFTKFSQYYNNLAKSSYNPEQIANLVRTDLPIGIHSACWLFAVVKKLIPLALQNDMTDIVKKINGGLTNMDQREHYLQLIKQNIK